MLKISIAGNVLVDMIAHAWDALPFECCGLLAGKGGHTSSSKQATNLLASRSAFSVPPEELFEFFRGLRTVGLEHTGIYHSHPTGPAVPSFRDAEEFYYRDVCYWIISLAEQGPDIRCYRWSRMTFEEIGYEVVD